MRSCVAKCHWQRHDGTARQVYRDRQEVFKAFYERHPERFVRGVPLPPELPGEVWINKPKPDQQAA